MCICDKEKCSKKPVAASRTDVFPVVVAFVGDLFLQDRSDGNHCRKGKPEQETLHENPG